MARRNWINPITLVVIALIALAIYFFAFPPTTEVEEQSQPSVPVRTQVVAMSEYRDVIEALGTAQANETGEITSQTQDIVEAI